MTDSLQQPPPAQHQSHVMPETLPLTTQQKWGLFVAALLSIASMGVGIGLLAATITLIGGSALTIVGFAGTVSTGLGYKLLSGRIKPMTPTITTFRVENTAAAVLSPGSDSSAVPAKPVVSAPLPKPQPSQQTSKPPAVVAAASATLPPPRRTLDGRADLDTRNESSNKESMSKYHAAALPDDRPFVLEDYFPRDFRNVGSANLQMQSKVAAQAKEEAQHKSAPEASEDDWVIKDRLELQIKANQNAIYMEEEEQAKAKGNAAGHVRKIQDLKQTRIQLLIDVSTVYRRLIGRYTLLTAGADVLPPQVVRSQRFRDWQSLKHNLEGGLIAKEEQLAETFRSQAPPADP